MPHSIPLDDLMTLIDSLRDSDPARGRAALDRARGLGLLADGTLRVDLSGVNLPGADLSGADLQTARLSMADLRGASLAGARLNGAVCDMAQFQGADFTDADLRGADLVIARLDEARISPRQFAGVGKLWRATMPDGSRYDGRYRLNGDLRAAVEINPVDFDDPAFLAGYYGVPPDVFLGGQAWADEHLEALRD